MSIWDSIGNIGVKFGGQSYTLSDLSKGVDLRSAALQELKRREHAAAVDEYNQSSLGKFFNTLELPAPLMGDVESPWSETRRVFTYDPRSTMQRFLTGRTEPPKTQAEASPFPLNPPAMSQAVAPRPPQTTRTPTQTQPRVPPTSPAARTVPPPTSTGVPQTVRIEDLYQSLGPSPTDTAAEQASNQAIAAEMTRRTGEMAPPFEPGAQGIIQGHGAPGRGGIDWGALLKTAGAMAPKIARGLAEPSTDRPYARMGYFAQQEDIDKREQELKLSQMGADSAMARQEAENRARAEMERQQIAAQMERERMSEEAAMERARLQAETQKAVQEHPLTAEQAAALGLPPGAVGLPAQVAGGYASQAAANKRLEEYYRSQDQERKAQEARYRLAAARQALQSPQAMMDPVYKAQLEAEVDTILKENFPGEYGAGQAARQRATTAMATPPPAAQAEGGFHPLDWLSGLFGGGGQSQAGVGPAGPPMATPAAAPTKYDSYKLSERTKNALVGIDTAYPNPVDKARAIQRLVEEAGPDERIELLRIQNEAAKELRQR